MKTILLFFISLSAILFSCSEENTPPVSPPQNTVSDNFQYPYSLNSSWYYTTRNFVTNLRPDSVSIYFPTDTLVGYGDATFEKDSLINGAMLRLLRNSHSEPIHSHTTREYYNQTDSGLIRVAYFSEGTNFGPYRHNGNSLKFSANGKIFRSLNDLYNFYKINSTENRGSLIFDDPPIVTIKYPIVQNEEWDFQIYRKIRITKKYTDFEDISLNGNSLHCIKIQRNWYYNSPDADTNYLSFDYFAKEGMVKRDFRIKDILVSNTKGPIGYIDVKEEADLLMYNIPP